MPEPVVKASQQGQHNQEQRNNREHIGGTIQRAV